MAKCKALTGSAVKWLSGNTTNLSKLTVANLRNDLSMSGGARKFHLGAID